MPMTFIAFASSLSWVYDVLLRTFLATIHTFLSLFNDRILIVKEVHGEFPEYAIPLFDIGQVDRKYELCSIKFVKNGKLQHMFVKNQTYNNTRRIVREVSDEHMSHCRKKLSDAYAYVELGGKNVTKQYFNTGWSLTKNFNVYDISRLLGNRGDIKLEFTDNDLNIITKTGYDTIVEDQLDFTKRS